MPPRGQPIGMIASQKWRSVALSLLIYLVFCGLTYLGQINDLWLSVSSLGMLLLPIVWAWRGWQPWLPC